MKIRRMTEHELLRDLNRYTAHADELAKPGANELSPLERLKGSVKRYVRPTDPVWDEYFDSEGVTHDFMEDRNQPANGERQGVMPDYITGLAALCIPHTGRSKPFWQSLKNPDSNWTVAGRNYPDTSWFFGERELVDVSQYLAQAGLKTRISMCASYERAVFDLLYAHIEQKGKPVPNVQASDIDDVVDLERIKHWVQKADGKGLLRHAPAMMAWLDQERSY